MNIVLRGLVILCFCMVPVCGDELCLPLRVLFSFPEHDMVWMSYDAWIGVLLLMGSLFERKWAYWCSIVAVGFLVFVIAGIRMYEPQIKIPLLWILPFSITSCFLVYRMTFGLIRGTGQAHHKTGTN